MTDRNNYCASCNGRVVLQRRATRRDECPSCAAELHSCIQCQHYDPRQSRGCQEPNAVSDESIRDVRRANLCDWFELRVGPVPAELLPSKSSAKDAFDALFGGKPAAKDPAKEAAEEAFAKLFKR
jgi:hypothetical protein